MLEFSSALRRYCLFFPVESLEKTSVVFSCDEISVTQHSQMKRYGGLDTFDNGQLQGAFHPLNGLIAISAVNDDLCDERIVVRKNLTVGMSRRIDSHAGASGQMEGIDFSRRRHESIGVFSIDSTFDTRTIKGDILLGEANRLAAGNLNLLLHQIDPRHHFRHWMLDLDPGVHFHEVEVIILIEKKLHRTRTDVAHGLCSINGDLSHFAP